MSGRYLGDGSPNALASMERIYGFLVAHPQSYMVLDEWRVAREGLATVADYHQVVSRLASVACQLVDLPPGPQRSQLAGEIMKLVEKLKSVSPAI